MVSAGSKMFFIPDDVYMTDDGGEWCIRKMANGFHVLGPWTIDSYGYWPTKEQARAALVECAGAGAWQ